MIEPLVSPVSWATGFLRAPFEQVAEELRQWREEIHGSASKERLSGGLLQSARRLEPLVSGVRPRELVVATATDEWTAVFDCNVHGSDPVSTVGYLSRRLAVHGVVVVHVPDRAASPGRPEQFGARQFELYGPLATDFLNYVRTISVVRDGPRWRFDASGTVQDFEDEAAYTRRRISDRLTVEMLQRYAEAMGLHPFDPEFLSGPCVLVTNPRSPRLMPWR